MREDGITPSPRVPYLRSRSDKEVVVGARGRTQQLSGNLKKEVLTWVKNLPEYHRLKNRFHNFVRGLRREGGRNEETCVRVPL